MIAIFAILLDLFALVLVQTVLSTVSAPKGALSYALTSVLINFSSRRS